MKVKQKLEFKSTLCHHSEKSKLSTSDVGSGLEILCPDGDLVASAGLESCQGVLEHAGLDNLDLDITHTDGVHEVRVGRDPGDGAGRAGGASWLHT